MKITNLQDFCVQAGYNYHADLEKLSTICDYTKTRVNNDRHRGEMSYGSEQCFLIKAIANSIDTAHFFEIGTGRGTASYAVSLLQSVDRVVTVDIVPHTKKVHTAIGYQPAYVSNKDICDLIPYEEKSKISFKHVDDLKEILEQNENKFDLAFIDGDHSNFDVIMNDFAMCEWLVRPGGVILFDDYHPDKFAVKTVADKILKQNPDYSAELVCFHGHFLILIVQLWTMEYWW